MFLFPSFSFLPQSLFDRAKVGVEKLVEKVGFFGILACASVSLNFSLFNISAFYNRYST